MFKTLSKPITSPEYLASAPVGNLTDRNNHFLKPGFYVLMDLDRDSRFGLKLALDLSSGRTKVRPGEGGQKVALLVPKAKWPNGFSENSLASLAGHRRLHVEIVDPSTKELMTDQLERLVHNVRPDVIVIDAFRPVRYPTGRSVEAFADEWAKSKNLLAFGVVAT